MTDVNLYDAPLYRAVEQYAKSNTARLHMPGHKGRTDFGWLGGVMPYDLTEIDETDNLYVSDGVIGRAQELAAKAFGAKATVFSAGGATLPIMASLLLAVKCGGKVYMDRACHISTVRAMALLDITPVWVYPERDEELGCASCMSAKALENACKGGNARTVFLTSPNYYGKIADYSAIMAVAEKYGLTVIVDNSHGTHLKFDEGKKHPLEHGAHLVIDSAHKTLPVLTGGAYFHSNVFTKEQMLDAMAVFGSTSPSYPIMASLDYARAYMENEGKKRMKQARETLNELRKRLWDMDIIVSDGKNDDFFRFSMNFSSWGVTGREIYDKIYKDGVVCEMADENSVVALMPLWRDDELYSRLVNALERARPAVKAAKKVQDTLPLTRPEACISVRQALFSEKESVAVADCEGRVAAELKAPYPPGIPVIMPGERIDGETAKILKRNFEAILVTKG